MASGRGYKAIAEYYDAECAQQEMLREDVPFLMGHLKRGQSVLEVAVGTGRAGIPLAQAGHRVVGIDNDAEMLEIARRKRDAVGLAEKQLELVRGDVLKMELGRTFDWVVVLFNTFLVFTTLEEQDRAMEAMARHLKPKGRLWIDVFQPNLELMARGSVKGVEPMIFYVPEFDRTVVKTMDVKVEAGRQVQRVVFRYAWFDGSGKEMREKTEFDLTFMFPRELRMLVERHGMRVETMYGNYDGSGVGEDSPRMIACCRTA